MSDFLDEFKDYLLKHRQHELHRLIPYYETIKQKEDELADFIKDCNDYFIDIEYEEDDSGGYVEGSLLVYLYKDKDDWMSVLDHHYSIELRYEPRDYNYCQCNPKREDYIEELGCDGRGCDWTAPAIDVTKVIDEYSGSFDGHAREMHFLEKEWEEHLADYKAEKRQKRLDELNNYIFKLQREAEALEKGL